MSVKLTSATATMQNIILALFPKAWREGPRYVAVVAVVGGVVLTTVRVIKSRVTQVLP